MKTIIYTFLLLLAIPTALHAQRMENFGKFSDKDGFPIKGTALERGYERQIIITDINIATSGGTSVAISIPNSAAVASFQALVNTKNVLSSGEISILKQEVDRKVLFQKITMSSLKVMSVSVMDNIARVVLKPGGFSQVFYTTDKSGKTIPVSK